MDNRNQVEEKLVGKIQQSISKDEIVMQVHDCYLGYVEVTIYYKQTYDEELSPIAAGILELLEIESPQSIMDLGELLCVDEATIFDAIQKLQFINSIQVIKGEYISRTTHSNKSTAEVFSQSIVLNPETLKIVDFDPNYHVSAEMIVSNSFNLTTPEVLKLFPQLKEEQIEHWFCQKVAGPHTYQVILYNQQQQLQRKILFNDGGHELYELERSEVDLSGVLLDSQIKPDKMIDPNDLPNYLHQSESWIVGVKNSVPIEIHSHIQAKATRTLLLVDQMESSKERKAINLLETSSKGMLTVFEAELQYEVFCLSKKTLLQMSTNNQFVLYTNKPLIEAKYQQIQSIIIELAKDLKNDQALKAFIYLVEQQTEETVLKSIIEYLSSSCSSNDLIHRGRILDNYETYKTLAKEAYEFGVQAHAREVNL